MVCRCAFWFKRHEDIRCGVLVTFATLCLTANVSQSVVCPLMSDFFSCNSVTCNSVTTVTTPISLRKLYKTGREAVK